MTPNLERLRYLEELVPHTGHNTDWSYLSDDAQLAEVQALLVRLQQSRELLVRVVDRYTAVDPAPTASVPTASAVPRSLPAGDLSLAARPTVEQLGAALAADVRNLAVLCLELARWDLQGPHLGRQGIQEGRRWVVERASQLMDLSFEELGRLVARGPSLRVDR